MKSIDIVSATSTEVKETIEAIEKSLEAFPSVQSASIVTHEYFSHPKIQCLQHDKFDSGEAYNRFVVDELINYFESDFCLLVQWDGYVINGDKFNETFLQYDYIGAPWPWNNYVGNGGFSLRSRKFCELAAQLKYNKEHHEYKYAPEDWFLVIKNKQFMEDNGIQFPSRELAADFSFEHKCFAWHSLKTSFGFHGPHNLDSVK